MCTQALALKQQKIEKENEKFARKFSTPHTSMYTGVKEVFLFACNFCTSPPFLISRKAETAIDTGVEEECKDRVSFVTVFLCIVFDLLYFCVLCSCLLS